MQRKRLVPKGQSGLAFLKEMGKKSVFENNEPSFGGSYDFQKFTPSGFGSSIGDPTFKLGQTDSNKTFNFGFNKSAGSFGQTPQTWGGNIQGSGNTIGDLGKRQVSGDRVKDKGKSGGLGGASGMLGGIAGAAGDMIFGDEKLYTDEYGIETSGESVGAAGGKGFLSGFASGTATGGPWVGLAMGPFQGVSGMIGRDKQKRKYEQQRFKGMTDSNRSAYALARAGMKLKTQDVMTRFERKERLIPVFKNGGPINIIPDGKLHKEKNSLGEGDKGIPVVDSEGNKLFELEKEELILHLDATKEFEAMVAQYNEDENKETLLKLGNLLAEELLTNTKDYSEKYGLEVIDEA